MNTTPQQLEHFLSFGGLMEATGVEDPRVLDRLIGATGVKPRFALDGIEYFDTAAEKKILRKVEEKRG